MTGDLAAFTAFFKARLDEDEARIRSLLSAAQWAVQELTEHKSHYLGRPVPGWHDWPDVVAMCLRALREVEAGRAIADRYTEALADLERAKRAAPRRPISDTDLIDTQRELDILRPVVEALAAIWSDHPDHLAEWKP